MDTDGGVEDDWSPPNGQKKCDANGPTKQEGAGLGYCDWIDVFFLGCCLAFPLPTLPCSPSKCPTSNITGNRKRPVSQTKTTNRNSNSSRVQPQSSSNDSVDENSNNEGGQTEVVGKSPLLFTNQEDAGRSESQRQHEKRVLLPSSQQHQQTSGEYIEGHSKPEAAKAVGAKTCNNNGKNRSSYEREPPLHAFAPRYQGLCPLGHQEIVYLPRKLWSRNNNNKSNLN